MILFFITLYQKSGGGKRLFGIDCNFKPTCSEYTKQAIFELENNKSLILSAESTTLHLWVITVMDILNKHGFNEVQIRTIEK